MHISHAKKRYVRRLAGYALNPLAATARSRLGREQDFLIGGHPVVLPPEHNLPFYQRRDATYDRYAEGLVAALAGTHPRLRVVDLGANVGDTAVAMLTAAPGIEVVAVEGSPRFAAYLRRNVADFGARTTVVERFVGPVATTTATFTTSGTTGGFQATRTGDEIEEVETDDSSWVSPAELLAGGEDYDATLWKSDIDGFDIHVLVEHWDTVTSACEVLWFEYDPAGTLGDKADIGRLVELLAGSGRRVVVYDNLGRRMVELTPSAAVGPALEALTAWLVEQRSGHLVVPYVDIWAYDDDRLAP